MNKGMYAAMGILQIYPKENAEIGEGVKKEVVQKALSKFKCHIGHPPEKLWQAVKIH